MLFKLNEFQLVFVIPIKSLYYYGVWGRTFSAALKSSFFASILPLFSLGFHLSQLVSTLISMTCNNTLKPDTEGVAKK
jgi:hypothetical protein